MKLLMGSDHGGIHLKKHLTAYLTGKGYEIIDVGTDTEESCDYPDFAAKLCGELVKGTADKGILVCGTGIGISIAANKCKGIRAAVCNDVYNARMSRMHNDANVLCMGERTIGVGTAELIVDTWLSTDFEGGRHARRVAKIMALEK
ncbi:MAG: ribose 5-phosphate isomerase B [Phascolarctobacterium sp.]|nr:ribose 5-phosphate isomerase B [Candidatus Phascolarctobacterium equi]